MKFSRIRLICVLLIGFSGRVPAQQIGFNLPQDSTKVVVPFESYNNLIIIRVIINGRAVLNFIVDTSIQSSVLVDKSIGDELGLNYLRKIPLGTTPEDTNFGHVANELNLELEGGVMTNDNHSILVLENDFLNLSNVAQTPVYGLIGRDIFGRFVVEIDKNNKVLFLHEPAGFSVPNGYEKIPIKFENGKPKVNVETIFENWDEVDEYMLLKTGAAHTILFDSDQNIFLIPPKKLETALGTSGSGDIGGFVGRVREIKLGKSTFEEPFALFTKDQLKEGNRGSIGMGLLSRFDMIIDFPGGNLYVRPNRSFGESFEYDFSGLKISNDTEQFLIQYVQKGSPAEKVGVKVGDQLVAVNGERLTSKNFNKVVSIFSSKVGKKVTLTLLKDGAEEEVTFKLVRFI